MQKFRCISIWKKLVPQFVLNLYENVYESTKLFKTGQQQLKDSNENGLITTRKFSTDRMEFFQIFSLIHVKHNSSDPSRQPPIKRIVDSRQNLNICLLHFKHTYSDRPKQNQNILIFVNYSHSFLDTKKKQKNSFTRVVRNTLISTGVSTSIRGKHSEHRRPIKEMQIHIQFIFNDHSNISSAVLVLHRWQHIILLF